MSTSYNGIDILPHRDPFLFLDRIEFRDGKPVGIHTYGPDRDFFRGHFPGKPIVPGVILLESMAQASAAAVLVGQREGIYEKTSPVLLFAAADEVRFRKPVLPGDVMESHVEVVRVKRGFAHSHVKGYVRGECVVEADIRCVAARDA